MALHQEVTYTIEDIYALPDGQRAELIDDEIPICIYEDLSICISTLL